MPHSSRIRWWERLGNSTLAGEFCRGVGGTAFDGLAFFRIGDRETGVVVDGDVFREVLHIGVDVDPHAKPGTGGLDCGFDVDELGSGTFDKGLGDMDERVFVSLVGDEVKNAIFVGFNSHGDLGLLRGVGAYFTIVDTGLVSLREEETIGQDFHFETFVARHHLRDGQETFAEAEFVCSVTDAGFQRARIGTKTGKAVDGDAVSILLRAIESDALEDLLGGLRVGDFRGLHTEGHVALTGGAADDGAEFALELDRANLFSCHSCFCFVRLILDDCNCRLSTTCGCSPCKDETTDVGDDFDDDEPPRVASFNFCFGSLDGVFDYLLDLFGCEFDFHDNNAFVYGCKGRQKNRQTDRRCQKNTQYAGSQCIYFALYNI